MLIFRGVILRVPSLGIQSPPDGKAKCWLNVYCIRNLSRRCKMWARLNSRDPFFFSVVPLEGVLSVKKVAGGIFANRFLLDFGK